MGYSEEPPAKFGKLVFEKDRSHGPVFIVVIGLLVLFGVVFGVALMIAAGGQIRSLQVISIVGIVGVGCAVFGTVWVDRINHLRYYENGIIYRSRRGTQALLFDDLCSFSYYAESRVLNGRYTGTVVTISLRSADRRQIKFTMIVHDPEKHLGQLRDAVAGRMAAHWLQQLSTDGSVPWLDGVWFTRDGLTVRPRGVRGSKAEVLVPFWHVTVRFEKGVCYLSDKIKRRDLLKIAASTPDLFPGLFVLAHFQGSTA